MIGLLDKNAIKVLTLYAISRGSRFNREEIKKKSGMNNISLNKILFKLLNLKILSKEKHFFSLNFENEETHVFLDFVSKQYSNLRHLPLSSYYILLEAYYEFIEQEIGGEVYLFGSYAKLSFKENSDIDIAVISDTVDKKKFNSSMSKIEKKFGKNIEVHYFSKSFYKNKRDPLVKEILQHGIKVI